MKTKTCVLATFKYSLFMEFWLRHSQVLNSSSKPGRLMGVLTQFSGRGYIVKEDLVQVVKDVLHNHPGLDFFKQERDEEHFQEYTKGVVLGIF